MKVLLVDAESPFSRAVAYCLAKEGFSVCGATRHGDPGAFRLSRYCSAFRHVNDCRELLDFAREQRVDWIMATGLDGLRFVDSHRIEFEQVARVPAGPTSAQLDIVSDKWRFAEFLMAHGLPRPQTVLPSGDISGPVLAKPRHGAMGQGIRLVENPRELAQLGEGFILQEYLPGADIGCSALCRQGMIVAHTIQRGILWRKKRGFTPAIGVEFIEDHEVFTLVTQLMEKLRWNGVANVDMRRDDRDGRVKILEVNGRYWASILASERAGVNFAALACGAPAVDGPPPNYRVGLKSGGAMAYWKGLRMPLRDATFHVALKDPLPVLAGRVWKEIRK